MTTFNARLIYLGCVRETKTFDVPDCKTPAETNAKAWAAAHEQLDPLRGVWAEVTEAPAQPEPFDLGKLGPKFRLEDEA